MFWTFFVSFSALMIEEEKVVIRCSQLESVNVIVDDNTSVSATASTSSTEAVVAAVTAVIASVSKIKQYNGIFLDGKMHGIGKSVYVDGSWYNGDWVKGMHDCFY